jgi:hypothetical protein
MIMSSWEKEETLVDFRIVIEKLLGRRLPRITEDNIITVDLKDISEDISWIGLAQDGVQTQVSYIPAMCCHSNKKLPEERIIYVINTKLQRFILLGDNFIYFWKSS